MYLIMENVKKLLSDMDNNIIIEQMSNEVILGLPKKFYSYWNGNKLKINEKDVVDSWTQYLYFMTHKMYSGTHNLNLDDEWYVKHLERTKENAMHLKGTVLDIGADDIEVSSKLFSNEVEYVGLEPMYSKDKNGYVIGLAEFLPFKDSVFDNVSFNTSLDHVFDYFKALLEAKRVLKKDGMLQLNTMIWKGIGSELIYDNVHFHHFKEYEIFGALKNLGFEIVQLKTYEWKNDKHRKSLYLTARNDYEV